VSHIDPRREHRRSKMLDHANQSVRGHCSIPRAVRRCRQEASQIRRSVLKQPLRHLHDIRCSGADDCVCDACEFDDDIRTRVRRGYNRAVRTREEPRGRDHVRPGLRMAQKKLREFNGEFDPWFSWLKANLPDTLAGRHLLDHIVYDGKNNVRLFEGELFDKYVAPYPIPWGIHPQEQAHLEPLPGEPNFADAVRQLEQVPCKWWNHEAWEVWLREGFEDSEAGRQRAARLRYLVLAYSQVR
jgi:hypothetical protein